MSESLSDLVEKLRPDPFRLQHPFSPDVSKCNDLLFDISISRAKKAAYLSAWLKGKNQPCLFGRHAANKNQIIFCILTDTDLAKGDRHLQQRIQDSRLFWKGEAYVGNSHAFLILILSKRVAYAEPDETLKEIARRLCQLYLSRSELNKILLDSLALRIETAQGDVIPRKWRVGVNWFGAQADGRWWHDHRIPGGVGFSMNSVGHMARRLVEDAIQINPNLASRAATIRPEKLVKWALPTAMRTIYIASQGSIPGTRLADRGETALPEGVTEEQRSEMLGTLAPFSEDHYYGWYHTDITIPEEYFDPSPTRPNVEEKRLLFTYLHRASDEDYRSMGLGDEVINTSALDGLAPSEEIN